jgi:tetratricopeptide (TPR) repeat protein
MKRLAISALLLVSLTGGAWANRFEAKVSSDSVTLADTVQLNVTLERDGNAALESYRPPSTPDFDVLRAVEGGQQLSWTVVNGVQSVRMVEEHVYLLRPKKKGALVIGPAIARLGGQELKTQAITVRVGAVPKNMINVSPQGPVVAPLPAPNIRKDAEIHVEATADKTRVYVGEQVNVAWRLWAASDILRYRTIADPKTDGFWVEDLTPKARGWERQYANGRDYQVLLLSERALFPLRPGKLPVTPLREEVTTMQSAMFATASDVAQSQPLEIDVRPLPSDGRPSGFPTANVGKFEMKAAIDRTRVAAGDAVTFKLTLSGVGNVHGLKAPKLFDKGDGPDGWRAYEPTLRENIQRGTEISGEKVLTYLLLPQRGGRLTIPALELPYFDPKTGHYEVARTGAFEVDVEGDPKRAEQSAASNPGENLLQRQIRPLHTRASVSTRIGERLFESPRLRAVLLLAPPAIWLLVIIVDALRRRLGKDTPRSRRRRARANARRRLRVAEYHIKAQRPPAFFGECARAIYEHLEFRLGGKVESFTLDELRTHLLGKGFSPETAEAIVRELENCDFARFAPSASGPGEMRAALRRVRNLLGFIETERLIGDSKAIAVAGLLLLALAAPAHAADPTPRAGADDPLLGASQDATFRRGNEAYLKGDYKEAALAYEQVAALGVVSEHLYYNLGNAYYKLGAIGPSIYNYERALEVDPSGPAADDARYNLDAAREAARRKAEDRLVGAESVPFWIRVVAPLSTGSLSWVFLALYVALFGLVITLRFLPPGFLRVSMWVLTAFLILGTGAAGGLLGGRLYLTTRVERAIVLPDVLTVHEGPDANYQTTFTVHAGLRVRITEHDQDWVKVRLQNGLEGWVQARAVGKL